MALSYLSTPVEQAPYVAPFDLNVMAKVLSEEQGKFDEEAKKEQNQIDEFGSLDVLKGQDKDYLNGKINNLVTGVNSLGGVNLADENVATKIEGLGSDIYGDDKVVNAVASTRQIRGLQASYQNLKTNPKLTKYYSEANEYDDNKAVNAYLSDGQTGSTYYGKNSATNYVPYRDNLMKAIGGIKANVTPNITSDGVSYVSTTGKIITPERVISTAADLLLPDEKAQMERDGKYAFKDANPLALVQQSLDLNNQKVADSKAAYLKYQTQALAAGNDPVAQANYKNLMQEEGNNLNQLVTASKTIQSQGIQKYSQDPEGYKAQVYKDQFYRGLGERFANSELTAKVTANPMALMQLKMQQQEEQFNQKMMFNAIKEGLGYVVDSRTGKVTLTGTSRGKAGKTISTGENLPTVSISDKNDPELYQKTEKQFADRNTELEIQKDGLFNNYFQNYLNNHPDVSELMQSVNSGTGVDRQLVGQDIFSKTNGKPGLQLDDLNFDENQPGVNVITRKLQSAHPELTFAAAHAKVLALKQIYSDYDKLSHMDHNPNADISKVDPALAGMVEQYQLVNEEQDANNSKISGINSAIGKASGLSDQEISTLNRYATNPEEFPNQKIRAANLGQFSTGDPIESRILQTQVAKSGGVDINQKIQDIRNKIKNANIDEASLKNRYYSDASNRPVFQHQVFTKDDLKDEYTQNLFNTILRDRGSNDNMITPDQYKNSPIESKNIQPTEIGRNQAGTGNAITGNVQVGVDSNKQPIIKTVSVDLEPKEAEHYGFKNDPFEALNHAVYIKGSTNPLLISATGAGGNTLVTKVRIVKNNLTDRVDQSAHPQIVVQDANGSHYIDVPGVSGNTASEVYATMKTYIQQFAQQGLTINQIVEQLQNPK